MSKAGPTHRTLLAAAYVRMSTEHQQYSTRNQLDVICEYAKGHGMEIGRLYSDEGKSGLNIQGRDSLAQMIQDVQSGDVPFGCILVYDVSRWGRFQDADESAHYEYICRQAGVAVHYCAEQFENDGSPVSTIVKSMKRVMAGEYSRELSSKVFQGACRLIQLGFKQGGVAGFGLRRMLVGQSGERKAVLKMHEQKCLQTDRVILVAGPEEEVKLVRRIYEAFLEDGKTESEIATELNQQGVLTDFGRPWTRGTIHQVLTNEKYIGNNLYHRTSFKLKLKHVVNPPEKWIRAEGVFEGIVPPAMFHRVHDIILARSQRTSDEEMLAMLRQLLQQHHRLSGILIDEVEGIPSSSAYRHRFGSLLHAYTLIGYTPDTDYAFIEINRYLRKLQPDIVTDTLRQIEAHGATAVWDEESELLFLNQELRVSIVICRYTTTAAGASRWWIHLDEGLKPDITIAVRMDTSNRKVRDYYLLPAADMTWDNLRVAEDNGVYLDAYRFDSLDHFFELVERAIIHGAV